MAGERRFACGCEKCLSTTVRVWHGTCIYRIPSASCDFLAVGQRRPQLSSKASWTASYQVPNWVRMRQRSSAMLLKPPSCPPTTPRSRRI